MARFVVLLALPFAVAVLPKELESFLYAPSGLDMPRQQAASVSSQMAPVLKEANVTITDLKRLKATLYNPSYLAFTVPELRSRLLVLAAQRLDPSELEQMYVTLYKQLDLTKQDAKLKSLELVRNKTDVSQLKTLYDKLAAFQKKEEAKRSAMTLAAAGCDPAVFDKSYSSSKDVKDAGLSGIRAYLNGAVRRYAKDGKAYTASEFQSFYSEKWLSEWLVAPLEKKVANDKKEYTASEFKAFYEDSWEKKWQAASISTQLRRANDGKAYGVGEFSSYYGDGWQAKWAHAPALPCVECA